MIKRSHATLLILPLALLVFGATAAAQDLPLTRYQTPEGMTAFAALPTHRKMFESNPKAWQNMGVAGHIFSTKQPGTLPLYCLARPTQSGEERFYSSDLQDVMAVQQSHADWHSDDFNNGIVGYVPGGPSGGVTKATYRYRQPNGKFYIYAFGEGEKDALLKSGSAGKFERVAFYVWAQAAEKPKSMPFPSLPTEKPDLSVSKVGVMNERKVIFVVRNNGFLINGHQFNVRVTAYQGNERVVWTADKTIAPVIGKGAAVEHSIEAPEGKSLVGVQVRVTVDNTGVIEETDESNNTSNLVDGIPISIPGSVIIGTRPPPIGTRPPPIGGRPGGRPAPQERQQPAPTPQEGRRPAPAPQEGGQSAPDLRMRAALYANGAETGKVNTTAPYASPTRSLRLKKSDAISCEGDVCGFNLGFFALRTAAGAELSTYALLSGESFGSVGNTVFFAAGETSKGIIHLVKLKVGENRIVVELDPYKKTEEADEANNRFEVTIFVEI